MSHKGSDRCSQSDAPLPVRPRQDGRDEKTSARGHSGGIRPRGGPTLRPVIRTTDSRLRWAHPSKAPERRADRLGRWISSQRISSLAQPLVTLFSPLMIQLAPGKDWPTTTSSTAFPMKSSWVVMNEYTADRIFWSALARFTLFARVELVVSLAPVRLGYCA